MSRIGGRPCRPGSSHVSSRPLFGTPAAKGTSARSLPCEGGTPTLIPARPSQSQAASAWRRPRCSASSELATRDRAKLPFGVRKRSAPRLARDCSTQLSRIRYFLLAPRSSCHASIETAASRVGSSAPSPRSKPSPAQWSCTAASHLRAVLHCPSQPPSSAMIGTVTAVGPK